MRRATLRTAGVWAASLSATTPARACPLCVSETGRRVRAGIFDADFGYHLAATFLPFAVFLAIVALIHFGPPWANPPADAAHPREDPSWNAR
ncbi:hypothetical protein TA3x_000162 [Tundrisphaera sp. TA3]|uniref:hypothetical protein n=1 Tax=Tundrisphaera sp. TA3 TaxID=3435775 RepID=UPI003EBBBC26